MITKYTPGPWTYQCKQGSFDSWIAPDNGDSDDSTIICTMERDELIPETDRRKSSQYTFSAKQVANARLIAAAPDLLAALSAMLSASEAGDLDSLANAAQSAQAAINKAHGGQS